MRRVHASRLTLATGLAALLAAGPATASFHLWRLNEVFSNEDGSIQYIEFYSTSDFQELVGQHDVETRDGAGTVLSTFEIPSNLPPGMGTFDSYMLLATQGFADSPGGVAPDFVIPSGFMDPARVTEIQIMAGGVLGLVLAFPVDGENSFNRGEDGGATGVAPGTPTNFMGETGTVPEPGTALLQLASGLALAALARRRRL